MIFLAIQVRQNNQITRETILRKQTDRNMGNSQFMAGTPDMMGAYKQPVNGLLGRYRVFLAFSQFLVQFIQASRAGA